MIDANTNNYINYGAVKDVVPQKVTEKLPQTVQNFDVKETVSDNSAVKAIGDSETDAVTLGLTGALWIGFAQMCQKLNNNLGQDWDKTWLGKFEHLGNKISNTFQLEKRGGKIRQNISKLVDKSKFLQALTTPTKPQMALAKGQARGIKGYVASDVNTMLQTHIKNGNGQDIIGILEKIDPDKVKDITAQVTKNAQPGAQAAAKTKSIADECLKYIDESYLSDFTKNKEGTKKFIKLLAETKESAPIEAKKLPFGIPNPSFLRRKGTFKELANKLNSMVGSEVFSSPNATKLGKALPGQALKVLEGLTNGGAGGKLMIVMQATIFAQAIRKAMKAPKGEKVSTFTENIASDFGYFLAAPVMVNASHRAGGLKYIGTGTKKGVKLNTKQHKEAVDQFHNMVKTLNDKVDKGTISRLAYKEEKAKIKQFLKGDTNILQRAQKAIGRFFSTGLDAETIKPFIDKNDKSLGTSIFNTVRKAVNKIKGPGFGSVLRFGIGFMVVGAVVSKLCTKVSHLVFGRPSKSILDKEEPEKPQQQGTGEVHPELGMTEEQFAQKLQEHPEIMQKMQTDPQFLEQLLKNPKTFAALLNNEISMNDVMAQDPRITQSKYITMPQNQTQPQAPAQAQPQPQTPQQPQMQPQAQAQPQTPSQPMNALDNSQSQMDLFGLGKKKEEAKKEETPAQSTPSDEPQRSYIPSSEPVKIGNTQDKQAMDQKVQNALTKAQRAEEEALKNLGI